MCCRSTIVCYRCMLLVRSSVLSIYRFNDRQTDWKTNIQADMSVCISVSVSICLYLYMYVCQYRACSFKYVYLYMYVCLSIYLSVCLSDSVGLSVSVQILLQSSVCVVLLRVVLMYYSMSFCVVSENISWAVNSLSFSEYI